jgi:hypothetical protein
MALKKSRPVKKEEEPPKRVGLKKKKAHAPMREKMPVNTYDEQMAAFAKRQAHSEAKSAGGNTISTKGGHFTIGGNLIKGDAIRVVCVEAVWFNAFYEAPWDESNPQPPDCYAYGVPNEDGDDPDMAPHEDAENPQVEEGEGCDVCPLNEWATANTGSGKACKNQRRVMLILEDDLGDKKAPFYMLNIPVTSVKPWATYVTQVVSSENLPTCGVLTEISIGPVPGKTYSKLSFAFERELEQKEFALVIPRIGEAVKQMTAPFPKMKEKPKRRGRTRPEPISKKKHKADTDAPTRGNKPAPSARKFARR